MFLDVKQSNSWCVAGEQFVSPEQARAEIYRGLGAEEHFTIFQTEIAAFERTRFKVYRDAEDIVIAIAPSSRLVKMGPSDSLEVFFDPYHDHVGYIQFYFDTRGNVVEYTHFPYLEAHSSAFPRVRLKEYFWQHEASQNVVGVDETTPWLFARFAADGLFRQGHCCGFNLTRFNGGINDSDAWNRFGGCGFQDATAFGHLYDGQVPTSLHITTAEVQADRLLLEGTASADGHYQLLIANPLGDTSTIAIEAQQGQWHADAPFATPPSGRFQISPAGVDGLMLEPESFYFDYRAPGDAAQYDLCMTYDIPDNLRNNSYPPERLEAQIDQLMDCGISKLYWIDYPTFDEFPAFWNWASIGTYCRESYAYGDLLDIAASISKRKNLEFWGIFKPFDLGFSGNYPHPVSDRQEAEQLGLVLDINNRYQMAWPEIVKHPEWTMRAHPDSVRQVEFPVTKLCLYSEEPIAEVSANDLALWISEENSTFTRYAGPLAVSVTRVDRPHYRWTPAGNQRQAGSQACWRLELSGLQVRAPFLSFAVEKPVGLVNLNFMLVEATDARGEDTPVTIGGGTRERGLTFDAPWNWNNYTEEIVERRWRSLDGLGLVFAVKESQATLFDPCYPEARSLWLGQTERILRSDAVGVDIRTLCHHNTCHSWLLYAFAPAVREMFRERLGREVAFTPEDYMQVRRIRGECYTEYMRDVRRLANQYGKKVAAHLEPGIEVPIEMNIRMQMEIQWKTWIAEGLIDEITLKYWTPQNRFVLEEIMPLARKAGIPVYQGERNFNTNCARAVEWTEWMARNTHNAGLAGFNFYEVESYFVLNPQGESWPVGNADVAIRHAASVMRSCREGQSKS